MKWGFLLPRLGIFQETKQSARVVTTFHIHRHRFVVFLLLSLMPLVAHSAAASTDHCILGRPAAMATLSRRSAKPGDHLELVVTVRNAIYPVIILPDLPPGFSLKLLRKPVQLTVEGANVWLFRYRLIPTLCGDYEISPFQVNDGSCECETKRLYLHVSPGGELPPLTAKELSAGVNIPQSLSEEVLKTAPQPTPKPTPSPTLLDNRDFGTRAVSSSLKLLKAFWNYPGK